MNYRSIAVLNADIKQWISKLPKDFDLIVGIPRSGLLAANLLALYLNLPLTDVEGLCEGRMLYTGPRFSKNVVDLTKKQKVLVIDDSVCSGAQVTRIKERIAKASLSHQIYYAAVYITLERQGDVDFWNKIVNTPRVFEWNLMHHGILSDSCVDIDGVLSRDPTEKENDDGNRYKEFLTNIEPLVIPSKVIGWLVTCRLEKYRDLTEKWLKQQKIQYQHLIMMDFPNKEARIASNSYAAFKAKVYQSLDAELFIESSKKQAHEIARRVSKPVFCTETNQMITQNYLNKSFKRVRKFIIELANNPFNALLKVIRFLKVRFSKIR